MEKLNNRAYKKVVYKLTFANERYTIYFISLVHAILFSYKCLLKSLSNGSFVRPLSLMQLRLYKKYKPFIRLLFIAYALCIA